jgi:hypothetical protein
MSMQRCMMPSGIMKGPRYMSEQLDGLDLDDDAGTA